MPDDFESQRRLFSEIERGGGLNEGDILKAINRIDADIAEEERLASIEDLKMAGNKGVNPTLAAEHARNAGLNITTGDQLKAAKPIIARMEKVQADPNIPADVRAESLARDKEDIEQLLFRSTVRDGQRGVEVVRGVPGGSEAIVGRPTEDKGFLETDPALPRFFPEPEPVDTQDAEAFIRTLEPETTQRSGIAGRRDVEQAKQRNAIRIAEFQAGRAKQFTLPQGAQRFETKGGETAKIAEVAPKELVPKAVTKAGIEGQVLQKVMQGTPLTPGEQQIYANTFKKGFKVTLADGTTISQGGTGPEDELGKLTPGARTQVQKEIRDARGRLQEFHNLAADPKFNPEENLTYYSAGLAKLGGFLDEISPTITNMFQLRDNIKDWNAFLSLTENLFTAWRRSVTGVAFRPEEETALRKAFPSTKDGPTAYRAKLEAVTELNKRIISRLQTYRPGDKIDVLGNLDAIQSEQAGGPGIGGDLPLGITEDDIQETIRQNPGETRESILLKIQGQ